MTLSMFLTDPLLKKKGQNHFLSLVTYSKEVFSVANLLHTPEDEFILFPDQSDHVVIRQPVVYNLKSQEKTSKEFEENISKIYEKPSLSPDKKYLACKTIDFNEKHNLILWDYYTGKQCENFFCAQEITYAWEASSTLIISHTNTEKKSVSIYKKNIEQPSLL